MNLVQLKKKQKGFTLVEVIVVAIIVAAMAAVAVPLYLNYVDNSRKNAAANAAGSVASFCGACKNSAGDITPVGVVTGGHVDCKNGTAVTSSIQIPTDITITITEPTGITTTTDGAGVVTSIPAAPGSVSGLHKDSKTGTTPSSYNF